MMIFIGLFIAKVELNYPLINNNMGRVFIGFFVGCILYELNKILQKNKSSKKFFFIYIIITMLVSILSYEFIEKNSNKYLRKKLLKDN